MQTPEAHARAWETLKVRLLCAIKIIVVLLYVSSLFDLYSWLLRDNSLLTCFIFFQSCSCILVPGGFGDRGVRGMILAAKFARENKIPYLGICLGMQISVIEYSRSVCIFTSFFVSL